MGFGRERRLSGSVTVEMTMVFPLCFLILILLMSTALGTIRHLSSYTLAEEAMMLCLQERRSGAEGEEAMQKAEDYMTEGAASLSGTQVDWQWNREEGFLQEAFSLYEEGTFRFLTGTEWSFQIEETYLDPVTFRNRVDLVVEVIKGSDE